MVEIEFGKEEFVILKVDGVSYHVLIDKNVEGKSFLTLEKW